MYEASQTEEARHFKGTFYEAKGAIPEHKKSISLFNAKYWCPSTFHRLLILEQDCCYEGIPGDVPYLQSSGPEPSKIFI